MQPGLSKLRLKTSKHSPIPHGGGGGPPAPGWRTSGGPDRILFVFGQGLSAWQGCDLLFLFSHAGFSTYAAIHESGLSWVPADVLRRLSGHPVFSPAETPNWVNRPDEFKLAIGIGLPFAPLKELAEKSTLNPALELILKKSCESVFFLDTDIPISDSAISILRKNSMGIRIVPREIGKMRLVFEKGFSQILAAFRRKNLLRNFSAQIQRTDTVSDPSHECEIPEWQNDLERQIFSAGFSSRKSGSPPDLLIETWDGPNPVKRYRKKKIEFSFDPKFAPPLPDARLKLRFVDSRAAEFPLDKHVSEDSWFLTRDPNGDLLLTDPNGTRKIPNLSDRPAFEKLVDILAMNFSSHRPG